MKIIALVGKTATGKDSIAKYISAAYGIKQIVSYATRPQRPSEQDGVEHYFVSDEQMDAIVKDEDNLLAFVEFPKTGYRYCSTSKDFGEDDTLIYVIDPNGIKWLKAHRPDVEVISIFLDLDEKVIRKRAKKRGDNKEDIEKRLDSEREIFDDFSRNSGYDARVYTGDTLANVYLKIRHVLSSYGIETTSEKIFSRYDANND